MSILTKITELGLCEGETLSFLERIFKRQIDEIIPPKSTMPVLSDNNRRWGAPPPLEPILLITPPPLEALSKLENEIIEYLNVEGANNQLLRYILSSCNN